MNELPHESSGRDKLRTDLGAYVLGGLPPEEARAVEAHLITCAACRAEYDELRPAASVLGELKRSVLAPAPPPVPADLGERVLRRIADAQARERRTAWARRAGLAAVAGAAAAAVLVAGLAITRPDLGPGAPVVATEAVAVSVRQDGVLADADLVNHTWGVEVRLSGSGFAEGSRFRVSLLGIDGVRYPAGEFVGTGARPMICNLSSSVLRERASGFEVLDGDGDVVVRSTFGA